MGRDAGRQEIVQGVEGVEQRDGGGGGHNPFGGSIFEVIEDDVYADVGTKPAEAVEEVGRHYIQGDGKQDSSSRLAVQDRDS